MFQLKQRKAKSLFPQIEEQLSASSPSSMRPKIQGIFEDDQELIDQRMAHIFSQDNGAMPQYKSENSSNLGGSDQKTRNQRGSTGKRASSGRNQKYQKIHDDIRADILFRCMVMNEPLKPLCKQLNINFSSAKNVIQVYKKEGRLNKKTSRLKRTENGQLVERVDQISNEVIQELKKKRCPVKIVRSSIHHDEIQLERNDEIYVPLSGRSGYDCLKVRQQLSTQLKGFEDQEFHRILQIAQNDIQKRAIKSFE